MEEDFYNKINNIDTHNRLGVGNYMISNKYLIEKILDINKRTERLEKIKKLIKTKL